MLGVQFRQLTGEQDEFVPHAGGEDGFAMQHGDADVSLNEEGAHHLIRPQSEGTMWRHANALRQGYE